MKKEYTHLLYYEILRHVESLSKTEGTYTEEIIEHFSTEYEYSLIRPLVVLIQKNMKVYSKREKCRK